MIGRRQMLLSFTNSIAVGVSRKTLYASGSGEKVQKRFIPAITKSAESHPFRVAFCVESYFAPDTFEKLVDMIKANWMKANSIIPPSRISP